MKIEKLNDNQIRCTLTRADLVARKLKLSELAYGTEKAKSLFQDMMQQASSELGFEVNNTPLMIEAIPAAADTIVLIITKVEDPEELDTRFSKFAPHKDAIVTAELNKLEGAEEFLDSLEKPTPTDEDTAEEPVTPNLKTFSVRLFSFATLDSVIYATKLLERIYNGSNTLYKDSTRDTYILALTPSTHSTSEFNKICNMLSEYGTPQAANGASLAYLEEHCNIIVNTNAVQQLATI